MIIEKILKTIPKMTPVNKRIAEYVIENKSEIGFLSIDQLSDKINVSKASVVRFSKLLDFTGYNEFKKSIQKEIRIKLQPYEKIVLTELDVLPKEKQYKELAENELNNLKETLSSIKIKQLIEMVNGVEKAKRIFLSGFGLSYHLMKILEYSLIGMNDKPVYMLSGSVSDFSVRMKLLNKNDIVFIATFPPYSKESFSVADYTKKVGAKLFLFTDSLICPIYPESDACVLCENNSLLLHNSYVSPLAMIQILMNMLILHEKEEGFSEIRKITAVEIEGYKNLDNLSKKYNRNLEENICMLLKMLSFILRKK